jgi:hypothetical protein
MTEETMMLRFGCVVAALLAGAPAALAQFSNDTLTESSVAWLLSGQLVLVDGAPTPAAGDEIGAFFENRLIGVATLTAAEAQALEYSDLLVFGDDPNTSESEGPESGDIITFRFFDASTNTVVSNVRALNDQGEAVNLAFAGGPFLSIPGVPIPIGETASVDLRLGAGGGDDDDDGGSGGGGQAPEGDPDVDGDGEITRRDAALVLRVVVGGARLLDEATVARADVNGDGAVSTEDAIAVLRAR